MVARPLAAEFSSKEERRADCDMCQSVSYHFGPSAALRYLNNQEAQFRACNMSSSISSSPDWIFAMVSSTATSALRFVPDWSPAQWLQVFYIVATGLVLGVAILPKRARGYLLTYGARGAKPEGGDQRRETAAQDGSSGQYRDEDQDADNAQETSADQEGDHDQGGHDGPEREDGPDTAASSERADGPDGEVVQPGENGQEDWFAKFVAFVTSCGQIPHSWFGGFYAVSLACSVFWLVQYLTDGRILHFLTTRQDAASAPGMEPGQVVLLWTMMFLQGCRRLLESLVLVKPGSKSTMWIVHWLLGNVYYITMSLSVWIEGSGETPPKYCPHGSNSDPITDY